MKKLFTLFIVICSLSATSQTTAYLKSNGLKKIQYTGTRASWVQIEGYYGLDTTDQDPTSSFNYWYSPTIVNIGAAQPAPGDYFFQDVTGQLFKPTTYDRVNNFTDYLDSSYVGRNFMPIHTAHDSILNMKIMIANPVVSYSAGTLHVNTSTLSMPSVTITGSGASTVTGTYPNITITTPTVQGNITQTISLTSNVISLTGTGAGSLTIPTQTVPLTASTVTAALNYTPLSNTYTPPAQITQTLTGAGQTTVTSNANSFIINTSVPTYSIVQGQGVNLSQSGTTYTVSLTKRQETYSASTATTGIVTITYGAAYSVTPNVQLQMGVGATNKYTCTPISSSTTGCSYRVEVRNDLLGLVPTYSNVSGQSVDFLITER
jgi:hypothetical protein